MQYFRSSVDITNITFLSDF